jgi:osmoprotectant transport system permease protein
MSPDEPLIRWDWVFSHLGDIWQRLVEHLVLSGLAVAIGLVISFALCLAIRRWGRLYDPVTWVTGVLYTIPSLALFALLVPITQLTIWTALIGLVSYTLLILIRNIIAGFRSVPPEVREAAVGMGYAPNQLLWRVELPLALSIIIAGVRVAAVTTIGLTTVTALIGQGGLGFFILEGIQRFFTTPLIVGAVLSVAMAFVVDVSLVAVQRRATPWTRVRS